MLPTIWFIDSYSLLIIVGIFSAFLSFERFFKKQGFKENEYYSLELCFLGAIVLGFVGSCLLQNLYNFIDDPSNYSWSYSITFYGGILFGLPGFFLLYYLYGKKKWKHSLSSLFQIAPACITLAHGFGRIGCFLSRCCYGKETSSWIGVKFPGLAYKVVPTNLLEAIFLFCLSAVLFVLAYKEIKVSKFGVYFICYGLWRFFIEYVRGDPRGSFIPGISPSQFWSIVLCALGIIFLIVNLKKIHQVEK